VKFCDVGALTVDGSLEEFQPTSIDFDADHWGVATECPAGHVQTVASASLCGVWEVES